MSTLLTRLIGFLLPGADDGDPEGGDPAGNDPSGDPAGGDPAGDLQDDEFEIDFVEDTPPAPRGRASSGSDDSAARLARLEAEVERRGRLAAEAAARQPVAPDAEFQREEERLRSSDITELERWQIQSSRTIRESRREANAALFQAQDISDRTIFESKVATDPRREKYRDRVEAAVQEERRQGRNASREAVYYFMLGKDIADGKLKPKAKAKTPAADIPRGRTPSARSDVSGRRGATEHDKRRARLENLNI